MILLVGKKNFIVNLPKQNPNWLLKEDEKEKTRNEKIPDLKFLLLCLKFKVSTEKLEMCLTFIFPWNLMQSMGSALHLTEFLLNFCLV